ncbi:hypothetical protein CC78DRAFT_39494 [Lojkania enalia]|uniref:Uncharacterized protein n=1 Tax=Lojkania enalia TaxID=147567 RepID=A0A9P4K271_9PLEO|nr:hypothetical protein CC78DRAFT_39494 [Didymosphaeria enalia]
MSCPPPIRGLLSLFSKSDGMRLGVLASSFSLFSIIVCLYIHQRCRPCASWYFLATVHNVPHYCMYGELYVSLTMYPASPANFPHNNGSSPSHDPPITPGQPGQPSQLQKRRDQRIPNVARAAYQGVDAATLWPAKPPGQVSGAVGAKPPPVFHQLLGPTSPAPATARA